MSPSPIFPLLAFVTLVALDVAVELLRRRRDLWWASIASWTLRPFAAWALVNAYFRVQPWSHFKFNRLTFPLYANPWEGIGAGWDDRAARILLVVVVAVGVLWIVRRALRAERLRPLWVLGLWLGMAAVQLFIALVPLGWHGVLLPWTAPNKVYAYAARRVEEPRAFLENFRALHPRLELHARTKPPGATLLAFWTQEIDDPAVRRNVVRVVLLASLNLLLVYALARQIFDDPRVAVTAAALAGAMPAAAAYHTYSLDPQFALAFNGYFLLTWIYAHRRPAWMWGILAGGVLFVLSMLTFAWSIAAAAAAFFVLVLDWRRGERFVRALLKSGAPALVALGLHVGLRAALGFDYVAAYVEAYDFHTQFYRFRNAHSWAVALVGGQIEFLIGMGPAVGCAFLVALARRRTVWSPAFRTLVACVLVFYTVPVIFGPNPLKLETARCWYWVSTFPVLAASELLVSRAGSDLRLPLLAVGASLASGLGLHLFLNFGA